MTRATLEPTRASSHNGATGARPPAPPRLRPTAMAGLPSTDGRGPEHRNYLDSLSLEERQALDGLLSPQLHPEGAYLYQQGELLRHLYVIHQGMVKVLQSTTAGRDLIMEFLFPGDMCGALCGCNRDSLDISAVCLKETEVSVVPREAFLELCRRHPGLHAKALGMCHLKVRAQREAFATMTIKRAEQRAAYALLSLSRRLGSREPRGVVMAMPMDREGFSELIGTTVETAIRALSRLRRKGLIQERGRHVLLRDEQALEELASR